MPPDGGLYVPERRPSFAWPPPVEAGEIPAWAATSLFPTLAPDLVESAARDACRFGFPLVEVEPGLFVLELFHGPTHAFKDTGARFMARVVSGLIRAADERVTVLVATSGDTGGAVAAAFHGQPGTEVVVLFPQGGVSERQRRQMTTLGDNVRALAVEGTFDDCQRMVKEAFARPGLREAHALTSANSINVARLLPQAIYYLTAAAELATPPVFVVPSGNLGNLCAGLFAWRGGMPAHGFTAATNLNRGFVDFLEGAPFESRSSIPTASNAMDVGAPSNLERIRWLFGSDDELRDAVRGVAVTEAETLQTIRRVFDRTGYVMDPHTAVAYTAAERHDRGAAPVVVLSTAHPGKFPEVVERAIGGPVDTPPSIRAAMTRKEHMSVIGPSLEELTEALEGSRE